MDAGRFNRVGPCSQNKNPKRDSNKVNKVNRVRASNPLPSHLLCLLLLLLLFLLTSISLAAQAPTVNRRVIHGAIVTVQGEPVSGAMVEVRDLHGMQMGRTLTDGAGSFEFNMTAAPGEYIVFASKEPQVRDERIALDRPDVEITIALPPASNAAPEPPHDTVSAAQLSVPAKAWKHLESAHAQFSKGDMAEAAVEIDQAMTVDPACAEAFSMRAFIRLAGRDAAGALEDARHAVLLDPHDAESFVALAMSYNALKEFQSAAEAAGHALSIRPDSWQGRLEMAKSLYRQDELIPALRELELVHTDFPDVHLVRGSVLLGLDRGPEAAEEFDLFLREAPLDPRNRQIRGLVATMRKNVAAATAGQE